MTTTPIVLVPGFWLGAWAWDDVAAALRADGHDVTALTLPGLESVATDRSAVTLADHIDAIRAAVEATGRPVVLAVHSGAGVPGYAVSDVIPEQIAAMVYVDSGPAKGALNPDFADVELPLPSWEELEADATVSPASPTSSWPPSADGRFPSRGPHCVRKPSSPTRPVSMYRPR